VSLDVHLLITCLAGVAEDGEAKVSVTVGLLSGEDTLQSDFPSGWDGRESDAELMAAQKSYVARWTYLQYYRVKPKHM
jgi:hypothetical protein